MRSDIRKIQDTIKARYCLKGEKYTKYCFNLNKNKWGEQVILALQNSKNRLTTETKEWQK